MIWTVENFLLMTWESLPRRKIYKDWATAMYVCDAAHGTALTTAKRKVRKIALDSYWDAEEIWETDSYNNLATDLATVKLLIYS